MSEWAHLQNAKHIDWVLQTLKDNPKEWAGSLTTSRNGELKAARVTAYDDILQAARVTAYEDVLQAWNPALLAIWDEISDASSDPAVWDPARVTEMEAARCVLRALIAYDNCEKYLKMSYDQLLMWSELDPHPACVLLLPYLFVKEKIEDKEIENV